MNVGQIYFDRYEVIRLLNDGGMSRVYLVKNIKLDNFWAIKEVEKGLSETFMLDEAHILRQLNHNAIPKIIDIEETETCFYIIEEYFEGINLKGYKVSEGDIQEAQVIQWGIELTRVIQYLHGHQTGPIIFRDIKPENIMITKDLQLKLVDFGIARVYKAHREKDTVPLGSRGYSPPEQYGASQTDERSDIFSIGVTIYFMLTGSHLGESPYHINQGLLHQLGVSRELIQIIITCCELLPEDRYQGVTDLLEHLESLQTIEETVSRHKLPKAKKMHIRSVTEHLHKTYNIGISGVVFGVGATHTALMIAGVLSKKYRVAIVSMDGSSDFEEIMMTLDQDKRGDGKGFTYRRIDYVWGVLFDDYWYEARNQYDFIIWDFGTLGRGHSIKAFQKCDRQVVVAHGMDWKVKELIDFYETYEAYDSLHQWRYVIPFCQKKDVKDVSGYIENQVYTLGFHQNPYEVSKEHDKWIKKLLRD